MVVVIYYLNSEVNERNIKSSHNGVHKNGVHSSTLVTNFTKQQNFNIKRTAGTLIFMKSLYQLSSNTFSEISLYIL